MKTLKELIKFNDLKELEILQKQSLIYPKEFKELYEIKKREYVNKYKK